jgi:nucleoside-diphosphate-sugar epimerase
MKAFVTGGSGFVGKNLIMMLRHRGWEVCALARSDSACDSVQCAGAEPARGDLHALDALRGGMRGCDAVFHSAALMELWDHEEEMVRVNVEGTRNTVQAAMSADVPCFVLISAAAVISEGTPVMNASEDVPLPDVTFGQYAHTKALAEKIVIGANTGDFRTVAVRPPAIWGSGDTNLLPELARAVRRRQFMWIDGGNYPYATCHVRNVCEGALLAAEKGRGGDAFFLTDGDPVTFRRFVTDLLATQGIQPGSMSISRSTAWRTAAFIEHFWKMLRFRSSPPLTRSMIALIGGDIVLNDGKARRELGYQAHFSREAGLEDLKSLSLLSAP